MIVGSRFVSPIFTKPVCPWMIMRYRDFLSRNLTATLVVLYTECGSEAICVFHAAKLPQPETKQEHKDMMFKKWTIGDTSI